MSLHRSTTRIQVYELPKEADALDKIRFACASKLQPYRTHSAGGGSFYVYAGDLKIRFADHENTSALYQRPDYNIVNDDLDDDTLEDIIADIDYPELAKKTVFAKHLGLTVPKLKKVLEPFRSEVYEDVCENDAYPNTYTEHVVVERALEIATANGITARVPIAFGTSSLEDWHTSRF